jgi:hypothetical protein
MQGARYIPNLMKLAIRFLDKLMYTRSNVSSMPKKPQKKKKPWLSLQQLEAMIFHTTKIERPEVTRGMARKAAAKVRSGR